MSEIHIHRTHSLGFAQARKVAFAWAEQAEQEFGMDCTYEEGKSHDVVSFSRSGVNGTLDVSKDHFELQAKLGFLLGAFKGKIEEEIVKNLDALLAAPAPKSAPKTASKPAAKKAASPKKT